MKNIFIFNFYKLLITVIALNFFSSGYITPKEALGEAPYTIKLLQRSFIPEPGIEKELLQKLQTNKGSNVHALIQFQKRLSLEEHKFLKESGIIISGYLGAHTYEVSIRKGTDLGVGDLQKLVRWAGILSPKDKLKNLLSERQFHDWALDRESGKVKLLVQFFNDIDKENIKNDLATLGIKGNRYGADNSWEVIVNKDKIESIASLDSVKMIQQGPIPFLSLNDGGRRVANSNEAQQSTYSNPRPAYNKVSGDGIQIGICDSGVDENHDDFDQITVAGNAGGSRVYNQTAGSGSHGTHVASITAGNGFNSVYNGLPAFSLRGHAPEAEVGDYSSFGGNAQLYHDAIVNDSTDLTNHSYVQSYTIYDAEAESLDLIVRGDAIDNNGNPIPARPQIWAAGNNGISSQYGDEEGYYAVFTSAKNTISIGSIDTIDGHLSDFSSRGPTFDGRIKPDIVAPGCTDSISSPSIGIQASDNNTQGYTGMCGTSMAAPVVSGVIALMMEQFQDTYSNLPNLPSTYKAMLIHSAKDMVKTKAFTTREFIDPDTNGSVLYHFGPDFATGYGLVDADAARDIVTRSSKWKESTINSTGSYHLWCISVPEGSDVLKVVIAWDDEPGSTITAEDVPKLVNDLDLELIGPDDEQYLPWTLDPLPLTANPGNGNLDPIQPGDVNPAYRGADHRNNVEMTSVYLPESGIWRAVVRGCNLPTGNAQPYSVVSSHNIHSWCYFGIIDFCKKFPHLCKPIDICERYPWVCDFTKIDIPDITFIDDIWFVDPRKPVPVDEICKYVIGCPGCRGSSWSYCTGWRMDIQQLPIDATISIINQDGKTLVEDKSGLTSRTLLLKRQHPGDQYFLLITDPKDNPYPKKLKLRIGIKSIEKS
ncbi:MAG: hypothetical protein AMS17_17470 [Spirochaetes bacterium DG_61]|nr:MAG: hypothetical protein AMS17_17470 [Spirochaetes bacterium DG_61]